MHCDDCQSSLPGTAAAFLRDVLECATGDGPSPRTAAAAAAQARQAKFEASQAKDTVPS